MAIDSSVLQEVVDALKQDPEVKNNVYQATVSRIDGEGVVWVNIAGSDTETPTAITSAEVAPGDSVNVEWRNNKLYIGGNYSNPSAGVVRVEAVEAATQVANEAAANAVQSAGEAHAAADRAEGEAVRAGEAADRAEGKADDAADAADAAQASATTANTAANGALEGLSTVQDVIGVLDWASKNAEYELTSDTAITPGKTYWTRSGAGTEADPYVYTPVVHPVVADIGTYYEISGVDEAMANYVNSHMALTDEGLYVMADGSEWKVLVADDGVYIIDPSGNKVAKYKADTTLGIDDGSQSFLKLDYHSMQLIDKEGDTYFYVSDLRNDQGYYEVTQSYTGNGSQTIFFTKYPIQPGTNPTITGVNIPFSWTNQSAWRSSVQFSTAPSNGKDFTISYRTVDPFAKAFTFGSRGTTDMGGRSVAFGYDVEASGTLSLAEGYATKATAMAAHAEGYGAEAKNQAAHAEGEYSSASGKNSHAEGDHSQAKGVSSHAEGYYGVASGNYSHAENGTASGNYSHAEGENTAASGNSSHAQNGYTKASSDYQTALGKYNIEDNSDTYAVIVGNGSSGSRSNAATLDWSGNVNIASGASYKINGQALTAANVDALPISGGTMTSNGQIINGHITNSASRETTPDLPVTGKRGVTALLATGSMATNSPGRGTILHCEWDDTSGLNSQLFISNNSSTNGTTPCLKIRGQNSGTWTAWDTVHTDKNTVYGELYGMSSNLTLSTSAKKVALTTFSGSGCQLSSNGIKVTNAGTYMINGSAYCTTGYTANDIIHIQLYKGSTSLCDSTKRVSNASPYEIMPVGPIIVTLAANDVIYLYAHNQTGARGTVATNTLTHITLHRIA